ncbi:uncharacterized protein H6S33_004199 [Morchella sextelata]|jgi:hypothetical protein|uniref:uncharacterized protein n=1 Tax=Morchella sextelata TaxID=1174677 RepID=UPI001D03D3F9|nr:uncharacterized protein H6S33_004199 [Morchella sextelata]KAH0605742.1 hypothetical protein H6S33_004199 [Morchella sextelata]
MSSHTSSSQSSSGKLARARTLFQGMIEDSADFKRVTEEDLAELKQLGRQTKRFWIADKKVQMSIWEQYQETVIAKYDIIEHLIGDKHKGCESLKAAMDLAFDRAQWSQKRYDAYCAWHIASFP